MYSQIVSFIREVFNEPNEFIPLHAPSFHGNEKKYLMECVDSTFVSSVGKYVDQFERMVAEYTGSKAAIVTMNGTNALHLSLIVSGVKTGEEVLTQPLTFIATANAISYSGADPVFIDVDKENLGLSPDALKEWLLNNTRMENVNGELKAINISTLKPVTACIPMHTFGHPCRIDEIVEICNQYNITVIEDSAESLGSLFKNKHTGTFGKLGILSFNGNKTLTTGGGGMILTQDEKLGEHIKHLTTQSKVKHPWEYIHDNIGYNYRMPNVNAALGVAQMEYIEKIIDNKRQTANKYRSFFNDINTISFIEEPKNSRSNYWLNAVILENREERDKFLSFTNNNGVMTRPIWTLMNKLNMFMNAQKGNLENAEWLEDRVVNIPSSFNYER